MKRTFATLAIAATTATGFAAPSFADFLGSADRAKVERITGHSAADLTLSQQAFIHALFASGAMSRSGENAAARIRNFVNN